MSQSSVPAAIDGLIAMFGTALPGVTVYDGQLGTESDPAYVAVAIADDDNPAVQATTEFKSFGANGPAEQKEDYAIRCEVGCWSGDSQMKPVRDQCYGLFATITQVARNDVTFGASAAGVIQGIIDTHEYSQVQSSQGALAQITFWAHVQIARI